MSIQTVRFIEADAQRIELALVVVDRRGLEVDVGVEIARATGKVAVKFLGNIPVTAAEEVAGLVQGMFGWR